VVRRGHLFDDVFPHVLGCGVTQEQIDTMLVDVPRRVLQGR
jgi:phosphotriesterase-related protein